MRAQADAEEDGAGWWKPFGYYATGTLFIAVGLALLVVDVAVGFVPRRVFLGEVGSRRRAGAPLDPTPKRAW